MCSGAAQSMLRCNTALALPYFGKGQTALLSLCNELYNEIERLEWRVGPELLRLSVPPHWANLS